MKRTDLIATIVGIIVGAVVFAYLCTMVCDWQNTQDQQTHEKRMKEYELMERSP